MRDDVQQEITKPIYSMFGDKQKGYKRFVYDHNLPPVHNEDVCHLDLDGNDLDCLYSQADALNKILEKTFIESLSDSDQLWPVDCYLLIASSHAIIYGEKCVNDFLSQNSAPYKFVATKHSSLTLERTKSASQFRDLVGLGLVEKSMCTAFEANNVKVHYDEQNNDLNFRHSRLYDLARRIRLNILAGIELVRKIYPFLFSRKPLLLLSNFFLSTDDFEGGSGDVNVLSFSRSGLALNANATPFFLDNSSGFSGVREAWKNRIKRAVRYSFKLERYEELLLSTADSYPISLIENRHRLKKMASRKVRVLKILTQSNKVILSIDHKIWKLEWPGAIGEALINNGGFLVGTQHGAYGLWTLPFNESAEQVMLTHFMSFSKFPFVKINKRGPDIIHVKIPDKLMSNTELYVGNTGLFSVWYFPHEIDWTYGEQAGQYQFSNNPRAEEFYTRQKIIINELVKIASDERVGEVVIKMKSVVDLHQRNLYESMIRNFLGRNKSTKIRITSDGDVSKNLGCMDLAIHDMFSTGALQTFCKRIPTIVLLSKQEKLTQAFELADKFERKKILIRNIPDLSESVKNIIEYGVGLSGSDYEYIRNVWCGIHENDIASTLVDICMND